MRMMLFAPLLALASASCVPNEYGRVAAVRTGAVIDRPAPRESPGGALEGECGAPGSTASSLTRRPYVQSVGPDGATLLWTSRAEVPEEVVVTRDGEEVLRTLAEPVATRHLRDARQLEATVRGLEPATLYCYALLGAEGVVHGPVGFRTAPARGEDEPVRLLVFGDSGSGLPDQWALREQMDTVPFDLILHVGDLAYQDGSLPQLEEYVFDVYADLMQSFPFYPALGNHDYRTHDGGPYLEAFVLPENAGPERAERYYSFDWGPVHVVALDTERVDGAQVRWLEQDLAANDLPWTIVIAHRSVYSSGHYGSNRTLVRHFAPIFERHGVQLVLTGHDHHYERFQPRNGVTYVVTGAGGASTRRPEPSEETAFAEDVLHFVSVHVEGDELRLHAIDAVGREFDAVRISRRGAR